MNKKRFPKTISNKYILVGTIRFPKAKYQFAKYKDQSQNLYFAKMWTKKIGMIRYFDLRNEIYFYTNLAKHIEQKLNRKQDFHIPRSFSNADTINQNILLIEKIQGTQLEKLNSKQKLSYLKELIVFLPSFHKLGHTENMDKKLRIEKPIKFIAVSPILFLLAIVRHPKLSRQLANCFAKILFLAPNIINEKQLGFIHRDLNSANILIGKDDKYIIDFQLFAMGSIYHDYANLLFSLDSDLRGNTLATLFNLITGEYAKNRSRLLGYLYYCVLFDNAFQGSKDEHETIEFISTISKLNSK